MKRTRKILGIGLSVLMILAAVPAVSFGAALPFQDVPSGEWYYNDVKIAYETGLINGMDATTFAPKSDMTYAQAVKLAACMHQKYTTGSVTLANGSPDWWDSYVDYAKNNNIIYKDYDWNSPATRAGYVEIFAYALPEEALKEINTIADGYIPDVGSTHPQATEIYKLYRAGILNGRDEIGTFTPDDNISRAEVAAILTRMMNESARKSLIVGTSFTVTFNSNGGSSVEAQTIAKNGKAVKPADPTQENYGFVGWYMNSTLTKAYDFSTPVTKDLTLYAKWTALSDETFTVSFSTNGGTPVTPQQVRGYARATKPADPTRPAMLLEWGSNNYKFYDFDGWYQDKELTKPFDFSSIIKQNTVLYAKWTERTATCWETKFDLNHWTLEDRGNSWKVHDSTYQTQLVEVGHKAVRPEDPTWTGLVFNGWYLDHDCTRKFDFDTLISAETSNYEDGMVLFAKWNDYTVSFETGEGRIFDDYQYDWVLKGGKAKKPANPIREGYEFAGWYTDSALTTPYDFSSTVTGDLKLYAKWIDGGTIKDSWDEVIANIKNGTYESRYKVGDTKFMKVESALATPISGMVEMEIVAIDRDELSEGGKAAITWISKDVLGKRRMDSTPNGNWESSEMRSWLDTNLKPRIQENVRNAIKPVKKYTYSYDSAKDEMKADAVTIDTLWLPSAYEILGPSWISYDPWENTGPSYKNVFKSEKERIKYNYRTGAAEGWWLRSAEEIYNGDRWTREIMDDGKNFHWSGTSEYGIVIGFCM